MTADGKEVSQGGGGAPGARELQERDLGVRGNCRLTTKLWQRLYKVLLWNEEGGILKLKLNLDAAERWDADE